MPWIEKRGKQRVVRWKTVNPDGSETVHASGRLTEPKAKALVEKLRAKLPDRRKRKAGVRIKDHSIHEICTKWKAAKVQEAENSVNYAAEAARRAEAAADAAGIITVGQATAVKVRAYRTSVGASANRPLAYLRAIMKWACDELEVEVPRAFFVASRPPPSAESEFPLLTDHQVEKITAEAKRLDQWPLIRCLMLYGWRPITACRILVKHVDLVNATIRLQVKRATKPHVHPLHPEAVELLRPLTVKRAQTAPLFLSRSGKPWVTRGDQAEGVTHWYKDHLNQFAPECGGTNALKRWALNCMDHGLAPWPRPLTLREIRLFTGHKTDSQAMRYLRHSMREAERLVVGKRGSDVVEIPKHGATGTDSRATVVDQFGLQADESVSFTR